MARSPEEIRAAKAAKDRRWRAAHPEWVRDSNRRQYAAHREVRREAARRQYAAHREAILETQRQRYVANPEPYREALRRRRAANPEDSRAAGRESSARFRVGYPESVRAAHHRWYAANQEAARDYQRRRRVVHPEIYIAQAQRRRAAKAGLLSTLTAAEWATIKAQYRGRCVYCGKKDKPMTQDHLVPVSQKGPYAMWNILPSCQSCNSKKGTKAPPKPVQPLLL